MSVILSEAKNPRRSEPYQPRRFFAQNDERSAWAESGISEQEIGAGNLIWSVSARGVR